MGGLHKRYFVIIFDWNLFQRRLRTCIQNLRREGKSCGSIDIRHQLV